MIFWTQDLLIFRLNQPNPTYYEIERFDQGWLEIVPTPSCDYMQWQSQDFMCS